MKFGSRGRAGIAESVAARLRESWGGEFLRWKEADESSVSFNGDLVVELGEPLLVGLAGTGGGFGLFGPRIFRSGAYSQMSPRERHRLQLGCSPEHYERREWDKKASVRLRLGAWKENVP